MEALWPYRSFTLNKVTCCFIVLWIIVLALISGLRGGLVKAGPSQAVAGNNIALNFSRTPATNPVASGQTFTFTAVVTNQDSVSRDLRFYAAVPQGTNHVSHSANLSYSASSLNWNGTLGVNGSQTFTFTLRAESPGTGSGGDIPVAASVFNQSGGASLVSETLILDWASLLFLPVILIPDGNGGVSPTPIPSPTPEGAIKIEPNHGGNLSSENSDYATALAGSNLSGADQVDMTPEWQRPFMSFSLVQCYFLGIYTVRRAYMEFDTSAIPANFSSARVEFNNYTAWPGPPDHWVQVYQGTWTQLRSGVDYELNPAIWNAKGALIGQAQGTTGQTPVLGVVNIPKQFINAGGITRLAFTTSTEGTPAVANSCYGGQPGRGASFSIPYLYIQP